MFSTFMGSLVRKEAQEAKEAGACAGLPPVFASLLQHALFFHGPVLAGVCLPAVCAPDHR